MQNNDFDPDKFIESHSASEQKKSKEPLTQPADKQAADTSSSDVDEFIKQGEQEQEPQRDLISYIKEVPYVGEFAEPVVRSAAEAKEDFTKEAIRNLFSGAGAKGEAALKASLEMLKGSDKQFSDLYEKQKEEIEKSRRESESRSPYASKAGQITGIAAPMLLTGGASLPAQMLTSGAVGAAEAAGEYQGKDNIELAKEAGKGLLLGAGTAGAAAGVSKGMGYAGEKILESLKDSSYAKQLAATAINAAEKAGIKGKSIFTEAGDVVPAQEKELGEKLTKIITQPIAEKNKQYTQAFEQATKQGRKVPTPRVETSDDIANLMEDLKVNRMKPGEELPTWTDANIKKYKSGQLDPKTANQMAQELNMLNTSGIQGGLKNSKKYVLNELIQKRNQSLDPKIFKKLESEKKAAWEAVEPITQAGKKETVIQDFQKKLASEMSPAEMKQRVNSFIDQLIKNVGKSTTPGEARAALAESMQMLEEANKRGNLGLNVKEIEQAIKNQGYLSAARQEALGGGLTREGGLKWYENIVKPLSPYNIAEKVASSPTVQKASTILLNSTPEQLTQIGKKLQEVQGLQSLGSGLVREALAGDRKKINAVIFTILQNPLARKQLQLEEDRESENEQ